MFNKPFLFQITGAVPYAKEVKGKTEKGIKVTGLHMTDEKSFLGDVELSTAAAEKLDEFLSNYSSLPIDGEVAIKFSKRKDLVLKFGKTSQAVDLKQIKVKKGSSRKFDIKITLLLPNVKSSTASLIYDNFKEVEEITIEQIQEELPLKDAVKNGIEKATGTKVLDGSTAFRKTETKKGSRRIPTNPDKKKK